MAQREGLLKSTDDFVFAEKKHDRDHNGPFKSMADFHNFWTVACTLCRWRDECALLDPPQEYLEQYCPDYDADEWLPIKSD